MPLSDKLHKAKAILQQRGAWSFVRYSFRKLVLEQVDRVVYDIQLDREALIQEWPPDLELQVYDRSNCLSVPNELKELLAADSSLDLLNNVSKGDLVFVVSSKEHVLHYGFVYLSSRQVFIIGEKSPVPLIGNCFTSPLARGRGLYRKALIAECEYLRKRGYSRVVIETSTSNVASQRGIEGAGFRLMREMKGYILFRRIAAQSIGTSAGRKFRLSLLRFQH